MSRAPFEADPAPSVVCLDIGEVLIDETRVWSVWADILGVSALTFAAVLGAAVAQGLGWREAMQEVNPNVDHLAFVDEHERRYGGFAEADLYPDVRDCISQLQELGLTVIIAGNQPALRTRQLRALDLGVEVIATSEELGASKPQSAFFDAVMGLIETDTPAQVLYVGDRVDNDVGPAACHGMRTCWLRRGPWGRLQDVADDMPQPDVVLEGLGELPQIMRDWADPPS